MDMTNEAASKYNEQALALLGQFKADAALVLILGGTLGHGMALAATGPAINKSLSGILRSMADMIDIAEPYEAPPNEERN